MVFAPFSIFVLFVGLLLWYVASKWDKPGIWPEVGRIMFFCGLLVTCFVSAKYVVHLP
jgi:hypothetical protein